MQWLVCYEAEISGSSKGTREFSDCCEELWDVINFNNLSKSYPGINNDHLSFNTDLLQQYFFMKTLIVHEALFLNPLHPKVSMHILHTVLFTFPKVLTRRISSTIKSLTLMITSFFFSWPYCVIPGWYCRRKLDACHS